MLRAACVALGLSAGGWWLVIGLSGLALHWAAASAWWQWGNHENDVRGLRSMVMGLYFTLQPIYGMTLRTIIFHSALWLEDVTMLIAWSMTEKPWWIAAIMASVEAFLRIAHLVFWRTLWLRFITKVL